MTNLTTAPERSKYDPRNDFRAALSRYDGDRLTEVYLALTPSERIPRPQELPDAITQCLEEPRQLSDMLDRLGTGARLALGLLAMTETTSWPLLGLAHTLALLGQDAEASIAELVRSGLLAIRRNAEKTTPLDLSHPLRDALGDLALAHPEAVAASRVFSPEPPPLPPSGPARQIREADGLEPILRMAALWQRVDEAPLRQTQQGTLYKRDRERLEDDPVLAGPIADVLEPLPDMVPLWLAIARRVGLVLNEPGSDRLVAAPADYWTENAVHLPQMIALRWLMLENWHEQAGMQEEDASATLAVPFVRPAALLWLAALPEDQWIALDDLTESLSRLTRWDLPTLEQVVRVIEESRGEPPAVSDEGKSPPRPRNHSRNALDESPNLLEAMLLGPAYQLGLVRAAEEDPSGRRLIQLTPLGRYVLTLGSAPPSRPLFPHFLFVQPNFEIIAYRQGLTPLNIGQLSRFMRFSQSGAALELKLTPESIYRGLEGGLTSDQMLKRLNRHSRAATAPRGRTGREHLVRTSREDFVPRLGHPGRIRHARRPRRRAGRLAGGGAGAARANHPAFAPGRTRKLDPVSPFSFDGLSGLSATARAVRRRRAGRDHPPARSEPLGPLRGRRNLANRG